MCNFCESLTNRDKEVIWSVRSTYADDNITEFIEEERKVVDEMCKFEINGYDHEGNMFVGISYRHELTVNNKETIIISPFSEMIQFNFCPICGKQLSNEIKDFDDYHDHIISIYDKE